KMRSPPRAEERKPYPALRFASSSRIRVRTSPTLSCGKRGFSRSGLSVERAEVPELIVRDCVPRIGAVAVLDQHGAEHERVVVVEKLDAPGAGGFRPREKLPSAHGAVT